MLSNEKILNLTFISTTSHGYLKVDKQTFKQLNFNGSEFSEYSYYQPNNNCFYLEEDCDAPEFVKIVKEKGYKVNFNEIHIDDISLGRRIAA
jgi:hypothetical protein